MVSFSCGFGQKVQTPQADPLLALPPEQGFPRLFLEQAGEQQHRIAGRPRQSGGVVGGAPQERVFLRVCRVVQQLPEQPGFQLFQSRRFPGAKRDGTSSNRTSGANRVRTVLYVLFIFSFWFCPEGRVAFKQKTRSWLATAGFLKIPLLCRLENSSHVANGPRDAMPNRHLIAAAHGAQIVFQHGVHFKINAPY